MVGLRVRCDDRGRSCTVVDVGFVRRKAAGTLGADDACTELVSDLGPPIDHGNTVALASQLECGDVAGWTGTHHDDVVQLKPLKLRG